MIQLVIKNLVSTETKSILIFKLSRAPKGQKSEICLSLSDRKQRRTLQPVNVPLRKLKVKL